MNKNLFRKSLTISIITLFSIINIMPVIANETVIENNDIILEYATIDHEKSSCIKQISLSKSELENIQIKLSNLFDELKQQNSYDDVINVLNSYSNTNEYPILSRILSNLFNMNFIGKRKLVISQGIGLKLNPLKDNKISMVKPFTSWLYSDSDNILPMPSATGFVSFNPFKIKTLVGSQFGFMLRFRGIYINIEQASTMKGYTFFIGTARHIGGFEFNPLSSLF